MEELVEGIKVNGVFTSSLGFLFGDKVSFWVDGDVEEVAFVGKEGRDSSSYFQSIVIWELCKE